MLRFLGTTTIGLAHGDILLVITPARSRVSISLCTHWWCFKANVYGQELTGGLSPVSMSIVISCVLPISSLPLGEYCWVFFAQFIKIKADLVVGFDVSILQVHFSRPWYICKRCEKCIINGYCG